MRTFLRALSCAIVTLLLLPVAASAAAPGDLDASFGTGGTAFPEYGDGYDRPNAIATYPDGRVLLAGTANSAAAGSDFALVRLLPDGSPDPSFDGDVSMAGYPGNGTITVDQAETAILYDVAVLDDGKILGLGRIGSDTALLRLNADGTVDTSFDGEPTLPGYPANGLVRRDVSGAANFDSGTSLVVRADGAIRASVYVDDGGNSEIAVLGLGPLGQLDPAFPSVMVRHDVQPNEDYPFEMEEDSSGRLVIAVQSLATATDWDAAVVRLTSTGALDPTFDGDPTDPVVANHPGDGRVIIRWAGNDDDFSSLQLQADGRIVLGGLLEDGFPLRGMVARLDATGAFDDTFGGDGRVAISAATAGQPFHAEKVRIDAAGRILVAGTTDNAGNWGLQRLTRNGSLDTSFGDGGRKSYAITAGYETLQALEFAREGDHVILAGYASNAGGTDHDFAAARVQVATDPPAPSLTGAALQTQFSLVSPIRVGWTGGGPSPVNFRVSRTSARWTGGFGAATSAIGATSSTRGSYTGAFGRVDCLGVSAFRPSGLRSPGSPVRCVAMPASERSLSRSLGWNRISCASCYQRDALTTRRKGASMWRSATAARRVAVVATTCPTCGSVRVRIGATVVGGRRLYSATPQRRRLIVFAAHAPLTGTLRVTTLNDRPVTIEGVGVVRAP